MESVELLAVGVEHIRDLVFLIISMQAGTALFVIRLWWMHERPGSSGFGTEGMDELLKKILAQQVEASRVQAVVVKGITAALDNLLEASRQQTDVMAGVRIALDDVSRSANLNRRVMIQWLQKEGVQLDASILEDIVP